MKRRENGEGNSILASSIAPFVFLPNLILLVLNGFLKPNRCFGHKAKKSQKEEDGPIVECLRFSKQKKIEKVVIVPPFEEKYFQHFLTDYVVNPVTDALR